MMWSSLAPDLFSVAFMSGGSVQNFDHAKPVPGYQLDRSMVHGLACVGSAMGGQNSTQKRTNDPENDKLADRSAMMD